MKFDRKAPGQGVDAVCSLESGRATIEWKFYFRKEEPKSTGYLLTLVMRDKEGETVLLCMQEAEEEEALVSVVLHPYQWNCQTPYLYDVEAVLQDAEGKETDTLRRQLPLREICFHPRRGWLLNGAEFVLKAVEYTAPQCASQAEKQRLVLEDLNRLKKMGANCIHTDPSLWKLCDRLGLLVWDQDMAAVEKEVPCRAGEGEGRLSLRQESSLFYRYKAKWSDEPFVYIAPDSISVLPSGNLKVAVYSNCCRVVLYSDGVLFEFQWGNGEFIFQEVPAKGPCITLSAEGDDCSMSLSLHKTFHKSGWILLGASNRTGGIFSRIREWE